MKKNIELTTLIFDLGGVIINIDQSLTIKKLESISKNNSNILYTLDYKNNKPNNLLKFFFEFEKGLINENDFRNQLNNLLNISLDMKSFDAIWNKLIISFNYNLLDLIIKLKTRYQFFVLSNTNSIHQKFYNELCKNEYGKSLKEIFHKIYYSHEVKLRKPEKKIYELILDQNKLEGNEVMFFDDITENLIASEKIGYKTYKVSEINVLEDFLKNL